MTDLVTVQTLSVEGAELLATGRDSSVYRLGNSVCKVYGRAGFQEVVRYHAAMNRAADSLDEKPYIVPLTHTADGEVSVNFRAARTLCVGRTPEGKPAAITELILGPTLMHFSNVDPESIQLCESLSVLDPWWASNTRERIAALFGGRANSGTMIELCDELDRRLEASGSSPGEWNLKIAPLSDARLVSVVITDLALAIGELRPLAGR